MIDRTFHPFLVRFYHHFSRLREDEDPNARENITIHERPTARWGSLIWITHNRKGAVWDGPLPGAQSGEAAAQQAWVQVNEILQQQKVAILFMDTFDLEHDEL